MFRRPFPLLLLCGCILSLIGCAGTVINMPKPLPDVVSTYKSVLVHADYPGMQNSRVRVKAGDYVTLIAKGEVDLWPSRSGFVYGLSQLFYRTGEKGYAKPYSYSTPGFTAWEDGNIYLGVADGAMHPSGEPKSPDFYRDNKGHFVVDIIVWQRSDPIRIADFLEEISRKDPQIKEIKVFVEQFNNLKRNLLAVKKTEKIEETKKETAALKPLETPKEKEAAKIKQVPEASEKKIQGGKETEKQGVVYEDSKAKVSITTTPIKPKGKDTTPPKISILSPETGKALRVSSKTSRIKVVGTATDESGVAEVTVNGEAVGLDEKGNFSSDVLLKVGENEVQVTALDIHKNQTSQSFKIVRESLTAAVPRVTPVLESKGKYYALVIGNNDYKYIQKLEIAKKDAIAVEKALREGYGFETRLLLDATRMGILNGINDLRKRLKEDDSLLIYYAGHGDFDQVADKAYWLPVDAERDNPTNWIMSDDITTNIKRMASKHILVVSDSCYSGTFVRSVTTDLSMKSDRESFIERMLEKTSRTLMSSGGNEPVLDSGGSGHSVFAEAFLKGLREKEEKTFTADELFYGVIRERVIGKAEQTPQYNNIRNSGHEGGDFVFMKK